MRIELLRKDYNFDKSELVVSPRIRGMVALL